MDFTLDDLREAADAKYGSFLIHGVGPSGMTVELVNALRLPKEVRDRLNKLEEDKSIGAEESIPEILKMIAKTPKQGDALLKALDGDLAIMALIFENYSKGTQAGEA